MKKIELKVNNHHINLRIDKFIMLFVKEQYNRNQIHDFILKGYVKQNNIIVHDKSKKVYDKDTIEINIPLVITNSINEDIKNDIDIVFEDDHIIVINKSPGIVSHPSSSKNNNTATVMHLLLSHCKGNLSDIRGDNMRGIVHRLDKDTSGLMILAKTNDAHENLIQQFINRNIIKKYIAIADGIPLRRCGRIETNIITHPVNRTMKIAVHKDIQIGDDKAKLAITNYKVLASTDDNLSLIECHIETGRTHQIRVHLAYLKTPILWDCVYGKYEYGKRQALHAKYLQFLHPIYSYPIVLETSMPDDIKEVYNMFYFNA